MRYLKGFLTIFFVVAAINAFGQHSTVIKLPGEKDGAIVRMVNDDTGELIDLFKVTDEAVVFPSDKYPPCVVRLENAGRGTFVLTDADIVHSIKVEKIEGGTRWKWESFGGYNDSIVALNKKLEPVSVRYRATDDKAEHGRLMGEFESIIYDEIDGHGNDILGYRLFVYGYEALSLKSMEQLVEKYPALLSYNKVKRILEGKRNSEATQPGNKFKDFTVEYDGMQHKLSDVVGHGDYVLLDFWASWCCPCRAEMPVIKEAYEKYKGENLKILGVAVSDQPANSLEAVAQMELPWEIWVNGGKEASQAYNVTYIPLLILFAPDGTILARGIQKDELLSTLEKYIPSAD